MSAQQNVTIPCSPLCAESCGAAEEATVTVHGGQYTFAVDPQTSRSALLAQVYELTGLKIDMDEATGPMVSFADEAESL